MNLREKHYSIDEIWPRLIFMASILLMFTGAAIPVAAKDAHPTGAFYVIQEGDTLWSIAARFDVNLDELQRWNKISNPGQISAGQKLVIPGIEGFVGQIDSVDVLYGENLLSLSQRYRMPADTLVLLNRLTSPNELYVGRSLILPAECTKAVSGSRASLSPGESLFELAIRQNTNPWTLIAVNDLAGTWNALPGDILRLLPSPENDGPGALPEEIESVWFGHRSMLQGKTLSMKISGVDGLELRGSIAGREFQFSQQDGTYAGLQGIHAMVEPGLYPLKLTGRLPSSGRKIEFSQPVLIGSGEYPFDPALSVDPQTLEPEITVPENDLWSELGIPITPEKMWDGLFRSPVPNEFRDCWTSGFGNRRSYNGSTYDYFHGGLDFCGGEGTQLYAPAAGKVVFTGMLAVRGNATVIDHGLGVYTAYGHQSKILVEEGALVTPGQVIGLGGSTGRSTGPHLHWEVWVGGVQVDPVDWLENIYP